MKEFNAEEARFETVTAIGAIRQAESLIRYPANIGLDVHKETIAVAVARARREEPECREKIANKPNKVARLVERLSLEFNGELLLFCYEAGPCGYVLYLCICIQYCPAFAFSIAQPLHAGSDPSKCISEQYCQAV